MKKYKKNMITIIVILIVMLILILLNPFTPVGALRIACLKEGYIVSAFMLQADDVSDLGWDTSLQHINANQSIYKISSGTPFEKATATNLELWIVTKNNFWYGAKYYGNG